MRVWRDEREMGLLRRNYRILGSVLTVGVVIGFVVFGVSQRSATGEEGEVLKPGVEASEPGVAWKTLPDLPDEHGFAGPFAGVHKDTLIVAGGANFPDGVPWHPTKDGWRSPKVYHDRIFVLGKDEGGAPKSAWSIASVKLPEPVGYGVSFSTPGGVLCVGGESQSHTRDEATKTITSKKGLSDRVFVLRVGPEGKAEVATKLVYPEESEASARELPSLPRPVTAATGALVGDFAYVVGGDSGDGATQTFWRLDLSKRQRPKADRETAASDGPAWMWEELPAWPGPARTHAIAAAQSDGFESCLFVFSGRRHVDGKFEIFEDVYKFQPGRKEWSRLPDIVVHGEESARSVMAGVGIKQGEFHILVIGGARGDVLLRNEEGLPREIAAAKAAGDGALVAKLTAEKNSLYDRHVGFSRDILAFNAVDGTWRKLSEFPSLERPPTGPDVGPTDRVPTGSHVTTVAVKWGDRIVIPSGEISPGVRSTKVWSGQYDRGDVGFGTLNWSILGIYLAALVALGFVFARRGSSADDYFTAKGRVPWWAAGLSIFGTMLSAITYLSLPARTYGTNWTWFIYNMGHVLTVPVIIFAFLPFFRRLRVTSAYQYLEARFDAGVRLFASASFILFQFGRMGIVVLLPALALEAATGIGRLECIVIMGVLSTLYTVLGGIEAVIWTDVLQVFVLVGGAIAAVAIMVADVDGGFGGAVSAAWEAGKFDLVTNFRSHDLSFMKDGLAVMLLGAIFQASLPYVSDQAVIQRYMTVPTEAHARRAIWTNALLIIPSSILFFGVGSLLFIFYQSNPSSLVPLDKADQIFPWFITTEMPAGLAGLVIAGVFAAAMSSLDSSMHSIATAVTTDFYVRFAGEVDEGRRLRFARVLTIILGIVGTFSAVLMASLDIKYLWDAFIGIIGLLLGTLGGLFALGIFTTRTHALHAWIGVLASGSALVWAKKIAGLNSLMDGFLSLTACLTAGILSSYLIPLGKKDVTGLTLKSINRDERTSS